MLGERETTRWASGTVRSDVRDFGLHNWPRPYDQRTRRTLWSRSTSCQRNAIRPLSGHRGGQEQHAVAVLI